MIDKKKVLVSKKFDIDYVNDHGFLIKDLDKDGTDELILFYHWYIVNGDNYDIQIYSIK